MSEEIPDSVLDSIFDAAIGYEVLLEELIWELVRSGALRDAQAAKVLLRAEAVIAHLDPDTDLRRVAVERLSSTLQRRPGVRARYQRLLRTGRRMRVANDWRRGQLGGPTQ